jgi:uncharacterized membrane protein YhdT
MGRRKKILVTLYIVAALILGALTLGSKPTCTDLPDWFQKGTVFDCSTR